MEIKESTPVPNFLRVSGHRATFDYRGLKREGHLKAACNVPYCTRCAAFGHDTVGCAAGCGRCGAAHATVDCTQRRSDSAVAGCGQGDFQALTPASQTPRSQDRPPSTPPPPPAATVATQGSGDTSAPAEPPVTTPSEITPTSQQSQLASATDADSNASQDAAEAALSNAVETGFRSVTKQIEVLQFARTTRCDLLFLQETNFHRQRDVDLFKQRYGVDCFFSYATTRSSGVGVVIFNRSLLRLSACCFDPDGRAWTSICSTLATACSSATFNCVVDSRRDVRGPGYGRTTWNAGELIRLMQNFDLVDCWTLLHGTAFEHTWQRRDSSSRLDRCYTSEFLSHSVTASCAMNFPPSITYISDHCPVLVELHFSSAASSQRTWRLDTRLLRDKTSRDCLREALRRSLHGAAPDPSTFDRLQESWRVACVAEGRALRRRHAEQLRDTLLRIRIVRRGGAGTPLMRGYLEQLLDRYQRQLRLCTKAATAYHGRVGPSAHPEVLRYAHRTEVRERRVPSVPTLPGTPATPGQPAPPQDHAEDLARRARTSPIPRALLRGTLLPRLGVESPSSPGPCAETPPPDYRRAIQLFKRLEEQAPQLDVVETPTARLTEVLLEPQISPTQVELGDSFPWSRLTSSYLPGHLRDFEWQRGWGVLPSGDRLLRWGVSRTDECPNCGNRETNVHAVKKCVVARTFWRVIRTSFHGLGVGLFLLRGRCPPGVFVRFLLAAAEYVLWRNRCCAVRQARRSRALWPLLWRLRRELVGHLEEQLFFLGEQEFLRRWSCRYLSVRDSRIELRFRYLDNL
ncbi:hypothetical protein HPB47_014933 [Ixodes persulcatus]|uniref:Uncharacterized protein n=1 Tax=Ixodes persulcatus TaxID=34615 RepID=A0AC60QX84_IXOPE|nr:hypothetical protein HPB47_014933 [Ixodes persulcatus]